MKLATVTVIAALALAGSTFAQPESDHTSGVAGPVASDSAWDDPAPTPRRVIERIKGAKVEMRLACAADVASLCADKTSDIAASRCIAYHRLKVSKPCRHAMQQMQLARAGTL
jgi:hypothetical protein